MDGRHIVAGVVAVVAFILFLIINPFVKISAGERGVILTWGAVSDTILDEGVHWITPIAQSVVEIDVTVQKKEKESSASSKDLQIVTTKIALNYRLNPKMVNKVYQDFKFDVEERTISPAIDEYMKKTTARYTAEELITKREAVKEDLRASITANLAIHGIQVVDIFMTDFNFSHEFNQAIERKVTAEQRALEEKNRLEQTKYEADQKIVRAKADAESIRIQAQAITQQGGKDFVQLKAVEKWDGKLPVQMIPGGTIPFIDVNLKN